MKRRRRLLFAVPLVCVLAACQQDPEWANRAALTTGAVRPDAQLIRERQTAQISASEERVLVEASQVLQDLGFTIEESAPQYGVLAGSKNRDAHETGQVVGQVALTVGLALLGVRYNPVWDTNQVIRTTVTTTPSGNGQSILRVSFERIVTNNQGATRAEDLTAEEFSSGFFQRVRTGLSKS